MATAVLEIYGTELLCGLLDFKLFKEPFYFASFILVLLISLS